MRQWEYLARNCDLGKAVGLGSLIEGDFNKQGQDGWEFVAVADSYAIFKRPIEPPASEPLVAKVDERNA